MEKIQKILNYDCCYVVEAIDKVGGMALYWNSDVKILQVQHTSFTVEAQIEDQDVDLGP